MKPGRYRIEFVDEMSRKLFGLNLGALTLLVNSNSA